jgi:hypothetical protein
MLWVYGTALLPFISVQGSTPTGLHSVTAQTGARTIERVAVVVTFVSATDVAVITTAVVAVIAGAVYVTPKGVLFVSVPQFPTANPEPAQPDCFAKVQVTPRPLVSPPTVAVKFCEMAFVEPSGVWSIISMPAADWIVTEIIKLLPPQPESITRARLATQNAAANRILFMQPPEFP